MSHSLEKAAAVRAQYGNKDVIQHTIHTTKFYPAGGISVAGVNLLAVGFGQTDADDTRTTTATLTAEESNLGKSGLMEFDFVADSLRIEMHIAPKARQHSDISGDADAITGSMCSIMNVLDGILARGLAKLTVNTKERLTLLQPFLRCPPGNGVTVQSLGIAALASQVNQAYVSQDPNAKVFEFPELVAFKKGDLIKLQLSMPDGASTATTNIWTNGTYNRTPVLLMRTYIDGWRIRN